MTFAINTKNLFRDIFAGVVVGLISIPISMGYAQIAGLPPVYGLYGSIFPVLVYAIITSSPHAVFGVDATPAALVGGLLAEMGIAAFSQEAVELVPVVALAVSLWLLFFRLIRAGRIVRYISSPVMGGFVSGIGFTIILMQVPKSLEARRVRVSWSPCFPISCGSCRCSIPFPFLLGWEPS